MQKFIIQAQVGTHPHIENEVDFIKGLKFASKFQYWHDPLKPFLYAMRSQFIGLINNENPLRRNVMYAANLKRLDNFVMVMFDEDSVVIPKESQHFEFYYPGQANYIQGRPCPLTQPGWAEFVLFLCSATSDARQNWHSKRAKIHLLSPN